ncbi:SGE1 [Nannizzia gypsea CBS 118893]|uniref:SGE1 n=1 Tax=Arthroderma gypseum (strain ATCC MYA-4604 / CBS 118893) TaxID=535722 RepID=E4V2H6_ARTGP|nr:SGE1 [Nannizzia gypsea CBS 118893]EFR04241.1 SGE1 [Nannizzia gypsea CBS 118893]
MDSPAVSKSHELPLSLEGSDCQLSNNGTGDLEKTVGSTPAEPVEEIRKIKGFKWFLFIVSTLTSIFVYALDNTIVANIVPAIVRTFHNTDDLPWLSVGFMIGGMAIVLPLGRLYALYDTKWVYIISTVIFMAASALCGAAPTMDAEIIGRVFAGAGGNGMYFGLLALISINTTSRERPQYLSLTGLVWGLGTVLGPAVGGGFELYNWRWAFYINLLFGAILLPIYLFTIPSSAPLPGVSIRKKLAMFDWLGAILSISGFVALVMSINFGGTLYAWNSGQIIALFVISGTLWILFAVQQSLNFLTTKESRMLPVHLCVQKEPILLFISCAAVGAVAYISVYYIPIYFQFTRGDTAIQSAVRLLPLIFLLITFMILSGAFMSRIGYYKPCYIIGSLLALVASILMATIVGINSSPGLIYGLEALLGIGAGIYTQAAFAIIQAVVDPADASNGITLMLIAQLGGMTLGLSISGAIFVNTAKANLLNLLPNLTQSQTQQILSGTSSNALQMLPLEIRTQALSIIVSAWQKTFICAYVGAAASFVCSIFLSHKRANVTAQPAGH